MKKLFCLALTLVLCLEGHSQPRDTVQLRAFMDGLINTHLRDKHIAGATVSIIQDGKLLMAQGYGFSDLKKQQAVSPENTLFRIGSISKMFTWVSVMQLVSQGKLKMDEDINHYLGDVQIPATYPKPITLKDIMTHTPGFEDLVLGLFSRDSTALKPLHDILQTEMPARVRPPGSYASYSNHGTGMAAYIVEKVSGMAFNDYVEKNILGPLNMKNTSFRQPLPIGIRPQLSVGYKYAGGEFLPQPFEYVPLYPVGAAASSATDMVPFMQALLHNGSWKGAQILDSATLAFMKTPAHQHHPSVNPMRYGFMDLTMNGTEIIGHGGDTFWFHSIMALYPESGTGFFLSFNTDTGGGTYLEVLEQFTKEYFPERNPLKTALPPNRKFLEQFAGDYRVNRYAYHDITNIASMLNDTHITVADSTRIRVATGDRVRFYVPIDSLTFREEHSSRVIAFEKDGKGKVTHMFIDNLPIMAFTKVEGLGSAGLHTMLFVIALVGSVLVLLYWPFVSWIRRGYRSLRDTLPLPQGARRIAWINYLLLGGFMVSLPMILSDPVSVVYGVTTSLKMVLLLPLVAIVTTGWMSVHAVRLIADNRYNIIARVYYLVVTVLSLVCLWQLYYWNFIGFNY